MAERVHLESPQSAAATIEIKHQEEKRPWPRHGARAATCFSRFGTFDQEFTILRFLIALRITSYIQPEAPTTEHWTNADGQPFLGWPPYKSSNYIPPLSPPT